MDLHEIMEMDSKYYMNTFGQRTPVCFEYGKGIDLYSGSATRPSRRHSCERWERS